MTLSSLWITVLWSRFSDIRRLRYRWCLVLRVLESALGCCQHLAICRLSSSVPLSLLPFWVWVSLLFLCFQRRLRFSRYLHLILVCNCTPPCSMTSTICGLLCLLLRFCPSHFQFSHLLNIWFIQPFGCHNKERLIDWSTALACCLLCWCLTKLILFYFVVSET